MNCENCGTELLGEYCHVCGQSGRPARTNLVGFLADLLASFLGADSRLIRSLRSLVLFPGRLTVAWNAGHRNRYSAPAALYLLAASAFFLLNAYHPFVRFDPSDDSVTSSLTGAVATDQLTQEQIASLDADGISLAVFKERFDGRVSAALAPLLIVAVILFSLFTAAVMRQKRLPYSHHAVFALHWCSFFLLLESIHRLIGGGVVGEVTTGLIALVYLIVATGRVYGGWVRAVLTAPLLMLGFWLFVGFWMQAVIRISLP